VKMVVVIDAAQQVVGLNAGWTIGTSKNVYKLA